MNISLPDTSRNFVEDQVGIADALERNLESSVEAAEGFIEELEQAYARVRRHHATASSGYGDDLGVLLLRFWRCSRYPHLIFYAELEERIDVWRVPPAQRDIPRWLQADGEAPGECRRAAGLLT